MTKPGKPKNFALIGAAGFVAPRHMRAIKETGSQLLSALDPNDSVGILDEYFPNADFFTEFERFDRHIHKLKRAHNGIDFISICSPNYLHDSHIRLSLRADSDVICEKPVVLNPENVDGLSEIQDKTGRAVNIILQLRVHPTIIKLKEQIALQQNKHKTKVLLTYVTSRGRWYLQSWKGNQKKSGGIATNIGVHFFDMLQYLYGNVEKNIVHYKSDTRASGFLEFETASVSWFLSIEERDIPEQHRVAGKKTFRSFTANGKEVEFSDGFTDLHLKSYQMILAGKGFTLDDSRSVIETIGKIRSAETQNFGDRHPFLDKLC